MKVRKGHCLARRLSINFTLATGCYKFISSPEEMGRVILVIYLRAIFWFLFVNKNSLALLAKPVEAGPMIVEI
jgi:hypothetical protein